MAIDKVGPVGGASATPEPETGKEKFTKVLRTEGGGGGAPGRTQEVGPRPVVDAPKRAEAPGAARPGCATSRAQGAVLAGRVEAKGTLRQLEAGRVLDQVAAAQKRLDHILQLAHAGKSFTPGELLAMQAQVYRSSQELDLAGKVVEKATGGVKQVLQTQI